MNERDPYCKGLLEQENESLRAHIKELDKQAYELAKRHTVILPSATDRCYGGQYVQVPICVGRMPLLAANTDPSKFPRPYRWTFERIYSDAGYFWRALPFVTEPERS